MKNSTVITNDQELTETFNDHYVNIIDKSSGENPVHLANDTEISDDHEIDRLNLDNYKNQPNVLAIIHNPERVLCTFSFYQIGNQEDREQLKFP